MISRLPLFNIRGALASFENELNTKLQGQERCGFVFRIDKDNYTESIGSGAYVGFKVYPQYTSSDTKATTITPTQTITEFYDRLNTFMNHEQRAIGGVFTVEITQQAGFPLSIVADVSLPMTYNDFKQE